MRWYQFIGFIFLLLPDRMHGQYDLIPINSQYIFNGLLINPAYAGSHDVLSLAGTFRRQWIGFEGAPQDFSAGMHWPMAKSKLGMGLLVRNEQIFNQHASEVGVDYAFRFILGKGHMSFGLRTAINMFSEGIFSGDLKNPDDPAFTDPRYQGTVMMPNFGFGMFYFTPKFYTGFSIPWFFKVPEQRSFSSFFTGESNFSYYNYLLTAGYYWQVSRAVRIKPTFLVKYQPVNGFQYDLNAFAVLFDESIWIGGGYRGDGTLIALLELQVRKQLKFGFSWDYPTGVIRQATAGSAEFSIRYDFNFKVSALSPRFF